MNYIKGNGTLEGLPEITDNQKRAINDFFYAGETEHIMEELNYMFRSYVEDPNIHCAVLPEVMSGIANKNLLINEIRKLLSALYPAEQ